MNKKIEEEALKFEKEKKKKKNSKVLPSPIIVKAFEFPDSKESEINEAFERLLVGKLN